MGSTSEQDSPAIALYQTASLLTAMTVPYDYVGPAGFVCCRCSARSKLTCSLALGPLGSNTCVAEGVPTTQGRRCTQRGGAARASVLAAHANSVRSPPPPGAMRWLQSHPLWPEVQPTRLPTPQTHLLRPLCMAWHGMAWDATPRPRRGSGLSMGVAHGGATPLRPGGGGLVPSLRSLSLTSKRVQYSA